MLEKFLKLAREKDASDLHLSTGEVPTIRVNGFIDKLNFPKLESSALEKILQEILNLAQQEVLGNLGEIDFAFSGAEGERYRAHAFRQSGEYALAIRLLHNKIPTCEEINLPQTICDFANLKQGLVLVTGGTGSGKSTTLAALVNKINCERSVHIITLEDPIEYRYLPNKSIIRQREIGSDTQSFASGLRSALREDPDVILVGELRDKETMATALTAAETGHLVLATLHTKDAVATINRILDSFPENAQQIRTQLAEVLQGIICQELVLNAQGNGRVAVFESLVATSALRSLIREGKTYQIKSYLETGTQYGMISREAYLKKLTQERKIK